MELILNSVHELKCVIDVFSSIVTTITLQCSEDCITISGIDPSHISLLQVVIDGSNVSYSCTKSITLTF